MGWLETLAECAEISSSKTPGNIQSRNGVPRVRLASGYDRESHSILAMNYFSQPEQAGVGAYRIRRSYSLHFSACDIKAGVNSSTRQLLVCSSLIILCPLLQKTQKDNQDIGN